MIKLANVNIWSSTNAYNYRIILASDPRSETCTTCHLYNILVPGMPTVNFVVLYDKLAWLKRHKVTWWMWALPLEDIYNCCTTYWNVGCLTPVNDKVMYIMLAATLPLIVHVVLLVHWWRTRLIKIIGCGKMCWSTFKTSSTKQLLDILRLGLIRIFYFLINVCFIQLSCVNNLAPSKFHECLVWSVYYRWLLQSVSSSRSVHALSDQWQWHFCTWSDVSWVWTFRKPVTWAMQCKIISVLKSTCKCESEAHGLCC